MNLDPTPSSTVTPHSILYVGGRAEEREAIVTPLVREGYRVVEADIASAAAELRTVGPALILIRLTSPESLALVGTLRADLSAPVIALSSTSDESDVVAALDQGADDCIASPFRTGELLARVRVWIRRLQSQGMSNRHARITTGELAIDLDARTVTKRGDLVHLTATEYKLLAALAMRSGKVVSGKDLLTEVWGARCVEQDRYLRVYMVHLRKKLEPVPSAPRYVLTEPGVGYRLRLH